MRYQFDNFVVDEENFCLTQDGSRIALAAEVAARSHPTHSHPGKVGFQERSTRGSLERDLRGRNNAHACHCPLAQAVGR